MHPIRMALFALVCCSVFGLDTQAARAETIFSEDFQSGKTDAWGATGNGDVRLTTYIGNISLRIMAGGIALTKFSTRGFGNIVVNVSFAAQSLGDGSCIADVSADGGANWKEIFRIAHGQDDGITLHAGGADAAGTDNAPMVELRLRTVASNTSATCWADNIIVTGRPITAGRTASSPSFAPDGTRLLLTADDLLHGKGFTHAVGMDAFAPSAKARPATNYFEGRLSLDAERAGGGFHVIYDQYGDSKTNNGAAQHLPPFDFAFVQSRDALVPVRRGAVPSTHPEWEFILEPGRVWDEPGDHSYSRASLPFTLEERNANCMHNGVLTFLFRKDGAVSNVAYEIGSETCLYFKFNMWGTSAARYSPTALPNARAVQAAYRTEVAARMPEKPISMLAKDYPGVEPANFGSHSEIDPADMTTYGVVVGGVHYTGGCSTRFGEYPYCDVMNLPSYSLAKSMFAGLGTMRLARSYPDILQQKIADYVPACAKASTWGDVTFGDALNMATGHFISHDDQADEDASDIQPFFLADDHKSKIEFACTHYPRKAKPGTVWVYHTTDIYTLGTALNAFYREKLDGSTDLYRDVMVPLWRRLRLSPAIDIERRTYDAVAQPFAAWGLTLNHDDVAKIATFINVDHGTVAGEPLVDPHLLMSALQRDPADTGIRASSDDVRYHDTFWAWNAGPMLGCKTQAWIPFMSGFGGIIVAMMPNGTTYYYFSDGGTYRWAKAAAEADKMKRICER